MAKEWLGDIPGNLGRSFEGGEGEIGWKEYMEGDMLGRHYLK